MRTSLVYPYISSIYNQIRNIQFDFNIDISDSIKHCFKHGKHFLPI